MQHFAQSIPATIIAGYLGAGKTTLFNVISGTYRPTSGKVYLDGNDITGMKPSRIAEKGGVRTFQRSALFEDFTVLESVLIARHLHAKETMLAAVLGTSRQKEKASETRALEIIDFIGLTELKDELAPNLSHGHQRALGIAMALATEPRWPWPFHRSAPAACESSCGSWHCWKWTELVPRLPPSARSSSR